MGPHLIWEVGSARIGKPAVSGELGERLAEAGVELATGDDDAGERFADVLRNLLEEEIRRLRGRSG